MIIVLQISDINLDKTTYGTCWSYESFITEEVHQNPCKSNICGLSKVIIVQSCNKHKFYLPIFKNIFIIPWLEDQLRRNYIKL
jgi:hypothetical protein